MQQRLQVIRPSQKSLIRAELRHQLFTQRQSVGCSPGGQRNRRHAGMRPRQVHDRIAGSVDARGRWPGSGGTKTSGSKRVDWIRAARLTSAGRLPASITKTSLSRAATPSPRRSR